MVAVPVKKKLTNFSLPNLLAGRQIVPEFVQNRVTPEVLGPAMLEVLEDRLIDSDWRAQYEKIHAELRVDASRSAAASVIDLVLRNRRGEGTSNHATSDSRR